MKAFLRVFISTLLLLWAGFALASTTALYFESDSGDYVGGGQEKLYLSGDLTFNAYKNYHNGVSLSIINTKTWSDWWYLDLAAPQRVALAVGAYENAVRFPFEAISQPGLSFSGNGRGCNTLTGRFDVLEAVYGAGGQVVSFAANFEQHCGGGGAALHGEIRYNSSIPLSVMTPAKITLENPLNRMRCVEATRPDGALVTVNAYESRDAQNGTNLTYAWELLTSGYTAMDPRISFNLGLNATETVKLTVTDVATGKQSTATQKVCVSDTTPPVVKILAPTQGATLVGDGIWATVSVSDLVDKNIMSYQLSLGSNGTVALDPATGTSSIRVLQGQPNGDVLQLDLRATARDASGNVGTDMVTVYKAHDASIQ
jgi:hypothetical protein